MSLSVVGTVARSPDPLLSLSAGVPAAGALETCWPKTGKTSTPTETETQTTERGAKVSASKVLRQSKHTVCLTDQISIMKFAKKNFPFESETFQSWRIFFVCGHQNL